ncbi:hypothetical protein MKY96_22350 [Paenibacillus sp. FSL R7-0302]
MRRIKGAVLRPDEAEGRLFAVLMGRYAKGRLLFYNELMTYAEI